jgi:hypothetical protein
VIAFNLTRVAGTLASARLSRAMTGTIRRVLIAVPARVASSARRTHPAPATALAVGAAVERAVHPNLRTTPRSFLLTTRRPGPTDDLDIPTSEVGRSATPTPADHQLKIV